MSGATPLQPEPQRSAVRAELTADAPAPLRLRPDTPIGGAESDPLKCFGRSYVANRGTGPSLPRLELRWLDQPPQVVKGSSRWNR